MSGHLDPETLAALDVVREESVFFGHQSVGANVLDGLAEIGGAGLVHEIGESPDAKPGVFHALIGRNEHPDAKIADFERLMRDGVAESVDIAFMKFCYVDAGHSLTAGEIFDAYTAAMERLEAEYPATTFVYLTMPLTGHRSDVKGVIKRMLGMESHPLEENIERGVFNRLLREANASTGRLFDIAGFESTRDDGTRQLFERDGVEYEALVPAYTNDGGHLNERGRRKIAIELAKFIANLN